MEYLVVSSTWVLMHQQLLLAWLQLCSLDVSLFFCWWLEQQSTCIQYMSLHSGHIILTLGWSVFVLPPYYWFLRGENLNLGSKHWSNVIEVSLLIITVFEMKIWNYWSGSNSWIYFYIVLNKNWKNLLVWTKFYWSWAGGPVLILSTTRWKNVHILVAYGKLIVQSIPFNVELFSII